MTLVVCSCSRPLRMVCAYRADDSFALIKRRYQVGSFCGPDIALAAVVVLVVVAFIVFLYVLVVVFCGWWLCAVLARPFRSVEGCKFCLLPGNNACVMRSIGRLSFNAKQLHSALAHGARSVVPGFPFVILIRPLHLQFLGVFMYVSFPFVRMVDVDINLYNANSRIVNGLLQVFVLQLIVS